MALHASAGEKNFESEEKVKLINPKITAEGYKIGTRGFTNYILSADDMVATATFQGADVDWYIKADDIVLKNKNGQPAGNPQPKKGN